MSRECLKFWNSLANLTDAAIKEIATLLIEKTYEKGELLLEQQHTSNFLYFINEGLVKMFFHSENKEFIMRFFMEGGMVTGLDSFITQQPSMFSIMAIEPTATCISRTDIDAVCNRHPCVERAMRNFYATASLNMMNRISEMLNDDAAERYANFVSCNRQLHQRISLGDTAAYLGITQVSLSRIRAKK